MKKETELPSQDFMISRIADVVNKVATNFNSDPFMTLLTLNRGFDYKVRQIDDNLKYG